MKIVKFQAGGSIEQQQAAPAPAQGPAQQGGQDPLLQIAQMMVQGLQNQDCGMLAQACEAFLALLQQAQAPAQEPIGAQPTSEPVFARKGGKLVKRQGCAKKPCRKPCGK